MLDLKGGTKSSFFSRRTLTHPPLAVVGSSRVPLADAGGAQLLWIYFRPAVVAAVQGALASASEPCPVWLACCMLVGFVVAVALYQGPCAYLPYCSGVPEGRR